MKVLRAVSIALFVLGLAGGTLRDRSRPAPEIWRGGYRVLVADLHVHSFLGDGALWPWDLAREARRRGLDAFAITNHNQVLAARIGRWCVKRLGGPIVLVGEEITAPEYHIIAAGIERTVGWRQTAAEAIADVHRQGGVAIAAHPLSYWTGFDGEALRRLDGTEVMHTLAYGSPKDGRQLRSFHLAAMAAGGRPAAIGSSDYHAFGGLGLSRTYVFVSEASEAGILEAIRARRTVVYDETGAAHGDPALVWIAGPPPGPAPSSPERRGLRDRLEACGGWLGLAGLLFAGLPAGGGRKPVET